MKVGDIMVESEGPHSGNLVCGSGSYSYAICVSVGPFVMVSPGGDMMWSCQKPEHFRVQRAATEQESQLAFDRFHQRGRWAPPPSSNELREFTASG